MLFLSIHTYHVLHFARCAAWLSLYSPVLREMQAVQPPPLEGWVGLRTDENVDWTLGKAIFTLLCNGISTQAAQKIHTGPTRLLGLQLCSGAYAMHMQGPGFGSQQNKIKQKICQC